MNHKIRRLLTELRDEANRLDCNMGEIQIVDEYISYALRPKSKWCKTCWSRING